MDSTFNLYTVILLIGAAHGLFLSLTLINLKDAQGSGKYFLAMLTLAFAVDLGHEFLVQTKLILDMLFLAFVDPVINFLYGPSFYLYTRILTAGELYKFNGLQWLHMAPFIVGSFVLFSFVELSAADFTQLFYDDLAPTSNNQKHIVSLVTSAALLSIISLGIYLALAFRLIINHHRLIHRQFSSDDKITLNWLRNLLIAISTLFLLVILYGFAPAELALRSEIIDLLYLLLVVIIYVMGYMGMKQPAIFASPEAVLALKSGLEEVATDVQDINSDESKYKTSALNTDMSQALRQELEEHMNTNRSYLNSQLTLPQLAEQLEISPNYLSQVINEQLDINFFDFINKYLVDEAKRVLMSEKSEAMSILDVAYEAGFNSKSAFYTAFNKHVGQTPTAFKKSYTQE